ncbi:hypothetical protein BGX27_002142 [Mortierella sp. AM989]|nr:hypothetical protein BGX27_002142 [Mortierella sp. AM989]
MNPFLSTESFLNIEDLFKSHPPPPLPSSSSQSKTAKRRRILSFKGSVVHAISKLSATSSKEIDVPPDLARFPIHRHAQQAFKKLNNGMSPDHIIWLQESNNPKEQEKNGPVLILDTDEEITGETSLTDIEHNNRDIDSTSEVSWSDSDQESNSIIDSSKCETNQVIPDKMVAVLLSDAFFDPGTNHGDSSDTVSNLSFKPGDSIWVSRAMLFEEIDENMLVSLLGVQGRSLFRVKPASPPTTYNRSDELKRLDGGKKSRKRRAPTDMRAMERYQRLGGSKMRKSAPSPKDTPDVIDIESLDKFKRLRKSSPDSSQGTTTSHTPLNATFHHDRLRDLDPLDLLVHNRRSSDSRQGNANSDTNNSQDIAYFSNIWSDIAVPGTVAQEGSAMDSTFIGTEIEIDSHYKEITTRHICWLTGIRSAMVRAICNECGNDYKSKSCVFYCRSHKWRLKIHMECSVSDGTAEVTLSVPENREDIMWTLLSLMKKSDRHDSYIDNSSATSEVFPIRQEELGNTTYDNENVASQSKIIIDQHKDMRNRILRIIARRGALNFNASLATTSNHKPMSTTPSSVKAYMESIDDCQTHQEKMEEKLWFNICTAHSRNRETFLLHATKMTSIGNSAAPVMQSLVDSSSLSSTASNETLIGTTEKNEKLKTSVFWINRRTKVQTLIRPMLVLHAVQVEWIEPMTEAKILLDRLLCISK